MSKEDNIKEKFKLAIISTAKAISNDYNLKKKSPQTQIFLNQTT